MNQRAVLALFQGILLASLPTTFSLSTSDGEPLDDREGTYDVITTLQDDVKLSTFAIKLKCRSRTADILSCRLYDPKYETNYHKPPFVNSTKCDNDDNCDGHLTVDDGSYDGNFEIKFRGSHVEKLTVSSGTSLKQLSFYRIIANLFFLGVNVVGKPDGTYSMIEESVYGKCAALVKIVHAKPHKNDDKMMNQLVSVTRTRNLDTCYPLPGLLLYDSFFYHPMMASVHYDIKSSISRFIVIHQHSFTSYTTEEIAVKSLEGDGNTTMLHVRTTLTLQSYAPGSDSYPRIIDPITVTLPFVDGFYPAQRDNDIKKKTPENT